MRKRISPATAISLVALFFSLGGAGMAASRYLITSVSQIKPGVRAALRGAAGLRGIPGSQGPQGQPGVTGAQGPAGPIDWTQTYWQTSTGTLDTRNPAATVTVQCDGSDRALFGGYESADGAVVESSSPNSTGPVIQAPGPNHIRWDWTGWQVRALLADQVTYGSVVAWVICVRPN